MPTPIKHHKQANSDYAVTQAGSYGAGAAGLTLGAKSGYPTFHSFHALRYSLAQGDPNNFGYFWDFLGDTVPDELATDGDGTASVVAGAHGGVVDMATGAVDDQHIALNFGALNFNSGKDLFAIARIQIPDDAALAVQFGFTDALTETGGLIFSDSTVAGATAVADDAVVVALDSDGSMTTFSALAVNDGGTPQAVDTGISRSEDYLTVEIHIRADGDATIRINGKITASISGAVANVPLAPYLVIKARAAAGANLNLDFVGAVAER